MTSFITESNIKFLTFHKNDLLFEYGIASQYIALVMLYFSGFAKNNVFRGLEQNKTYRYRLRISNDNGHSPWSQVIAVTTTSKFIIASVWPSEVY